MTYLSFLVVFLMVPLAAVGLLRLRDAGRGRRRPRALSAWPAAWVVGVHVLVAVVYTTPWDNYLVATGVWFYDPSLVLGVTLGWVPLEEYLFFVLQSLLIGGWLLWLARRLPLPAERLHPQGLALRVGGAALLLVGALTAAGVLWAGWRPGTYLALTLAWALPPIALQLATGADILWQHRRLVAAALLPPVAFLSAADTLAIRAGTWTIAPGQSLGVFLGTLPLEELVFFGLTSTLLVFGMVLALAPETQARVEPVLARLRLLKTRPAGPAWPGRSEP